MEVVDGFVLEASINFDRPPNPMAVEAWRRLMLAPLLFVTVRFW